MMKKIGLALLVVATLTAVSGCGPSQDLPDLGQVTGTVTLDGKPLADANIAFEPQAGGAVSTGQSDSSGQYEIWYNADVKGAALGKHVVRIEKFPDPEEHEGDFVLLPDKYNVESTLTADVKPGNNENVNFELTSK